MDLVTVPLPDLDRAEVVVPAPDSGPGNWAGAASAVLVDDEVYLAYRVRRPLTAGRGVSVVVARSRDGLRFETVSEVWRDDFGAESFERPVVLRTPAGGWRLYVSCATPDSKHWWIEAIDAERPDGFATGRRTVVLPGSDAVAVKDPVIVVDAAGDWHAWVCEHPLTDPGDEDRMSTAYFSSQGGLAWTRRATVLRPRPGQWDARGARVTDVLSLHPLVTLYDGRPRAADNWHETTGVARALTAGDPGSALEADAGEPLRSPCSDGACRYVTSVRMPDGTRRFYLEVARPDGAHDLVSTTGA
ncbi:hypothetical protein [Nocardioides cynanchi]|uniref:hypothetical protein n=1 Tax=Nocardioides cynanchi TaxID=2558918 RepID=UPI001243D868|nr:hypothetical protein [Nocardioides cynanchi]